jgi:hypothetical protein
MLPRGFESHPFRQFPGVSEPASTVMSAGRVEERTERARKLQLPLLADYLAILHIKIQRVRVTPSYR